VSDVLLVQLSAWLVSTITGLRHVKHDKNHNRLQKYICTTSPATAIKQNVHSVAGLVKPLKHLAGHQHSAIS